jgi:hypothetical protein
MDVDALAGLAFAEFSKKSASKTSNATITTAMSTQRDRRGFAT